MLTDEQIRCLSPNAASHYEANVFAEMTPEFYPHPKNSEAMMSYMAAHSMPLTYDNFRQAFAKLKQENKLIILPTPEELAKMSSAELKEWSRFPDMISRVAATAPPVSEKPAHKQRTYSAADYAPVNAKLIGYRPTPRELAAWTADQFRRWQLANPGVEL